jgi:hypothetical protein
MRMASSNSRGMNNDDTRRCSVVRGRMRRPAALVLIALSLLGCPGLRRDKSDEPEPAGSATSDGETETGAGPAE